VAFVADVGFRVIVRGQRVAFIVIQAVAIRRHAGHENIARNAVATRLHGGLHLCRGGAALPIVDIVVDHVEAPPIQGLLDSVGIVAIRHQMAKPNQK